VLRQACGRWGIATALRLSFFLSQPDARRIAIDELDTGRLKRANDGRDGGLMLRLIGFDLGDGVAMHARLLGKIAHGPFQQTARRAHMCTCHFNVHMS